MLTLYVHIPFCVGKCPYCGFYSTPYTPENADAFIIALNREASGYQAAFSDRIFYSVYIGGGTPSILSSQQTSRVLSIITDNFHLAENLEFTVEANPHSITKQTLAAWRERGVNRLSLGVQSFSDDLLLALGRPHTAAHAEEAFLLARDSGFQNIGIDLIYGIPGQTMSQWKTTLDRAGRCRPEHLSVYSLSLDDGSRWKTEAGAGSFALPDDDLAADMYEYAATELARAGYGRYEISNFALPGRECRHNMNYWVRGDYLGLGPGASSYFSGRRHHTVADTEEYSRRLSAGESTVADAEFPGPEQASRETIFLNLRTMQGIDLHRYKKEYGPRYFERLERNMTPLLGAGLLRISGGRMHLTDRGILLSNEAISRLSA